MKNPKNPKKPRKSINFRKFWRFFPAVCQSKFARFRVSPGGTREKSKNRPKTPKNPQKSMILTKKWSKNTKNGTFFENPFLRSWPIEIEPITSFLTKKWAKKWSILTKFRSYKTRFQTANSVKWGVFFLNAKKNCTKPSCYIKRYIYNIIVTAHFLIKYVQNRG